MSIDIHLHTRGERWSVNVNHYDEAAGFATFNMQCGDGHLAVFVPATDWPRFRATVLLAMSGKEADPVEGASCEQPAAAVG